MTNLLPPLPKAGVSFTIVVPTYNEELDIDRTCEALAQLQGPPPEVIFVDGASRDRTVEKILAHQGVLRLRVITEATRTGVSRARNLGINAATGNVVVLLNADALLPADFLVRLAPHYEAGAVYVKVQSEVMNVRTIWCRYVRAQHIHEFGDFERVGWTEGFSCRTDAAKAVGLFAEGLPGAGGEDGDFASRLAQRFGPGVTDGAIVVPHVAPDEFRPFFFQWYGRGKAVPFVETVVDKRRMPLVIGRRIAAWALSAVVVGSVVPVARYAWRVARHSSHRSRDLLGFAAARIVQIGAHRLGEAAGLLAVIRQRPMSHAAQHHP